MSLPIPKLLGSTIVLSLLPCAYAFTSAIKESTLLLSHVMKGTLVIWSIIEILFYIYYLHARKRLQQTNKPHKPLNETERASLFWNCVQTIDNVATWSEGWFYYKKDHSHPQFKEIQRENLALWFAWAFWHENLEVVRKDEAWSNEIEWMLDSAEDWFKVKFPKGQNKELQCIRLNLDPVHACHRPLIVYVGLYVLTMLFNMIFLQWMLAFTAYDTTLSGVVWGGILGHLHYAIQYTKALLFKSEEAPDKKDLLPRAISYFYRGSSSNNKTPLVFLHGIGAGVVCYAELIHQLVSLDRPIFLVELPYVAMRMVDYVPSAAETVDEIQAMLKSFGYDKAVYISHSMGTGASSWVMNMAPETIAGLVMIDPICFLLHYHNVAFNFVHRIPKTFIEYIMHYGAARELYISNYISRHFQWFETIYFSQPSNCAQLPVLPSPLDTKGPLANATVFLSEKDGIVGSSVVHNYLLERGVDARIMEGLEHAMFLSSRYWKKTISNQIDTIARKADIK